MGHRFLFAGPSQFMPGGCSLFSWRATLPPRPAPCLYEIPTESIVRTHTRPIPAQPVCVDQKTRSRLVQQAHRSKRTMAVAGRARATALLGAPGRRTARSIHEGPDTIEELLDRHLVKKTSTSASLLDDGSVEGRGAAAADELQAGGAGPVPGHPPGHAVLRVAPRQRRAVARRAARQRQARVRGGARGAGPGGGDAASDRRPRRRAGGARPPR
jgi:hypothetical protein